MGEFSREEFCRGCDALNITSLHTFTARLPMLRGRFDSPESFEAIYNFTFSWACPRGKKFLDQDSAIAMWQLLWTGRQSWTFAEQWYQFLEDSHGRPINADTWKLLLQFKKVCQGRAAQLVAHQQSSASESAGCNLPVGMPL